MLLLLFLIAGCGAATQNAQNHPNSSSKSTKKSVVTLPTPTKAIPTFIVSPVVTVSASTPARLRIPSIGLDAPVEDVNITANGDLGTPIQNEWEGVGWYSNGPRPGQAGSAVIDGHLDRPGGFPAVFWNLRYVQVGNVITVVDTNGKSLQFRVTRTAAYQPQDAPLQEIFGDNGGTYLNLITCAGTWIPSEKQTTLRLVVYATLISQ